MVTVLLLPCRRFHCSCSRWLGYIQSLPPEPVSIAVLWNANHALPGDEDALEIYSWTPPNYHIQVEALPHLPVHYSFSDFRNPFDVCPTCSSLSSARTIARPWSTETQ
ncbi:hypothetical protein A0H81_00111 [Grifola frondosa]|uniref:Uncharacterized protein n=1 Tax=Grifola frondosa TaxID=5627 RepID=A0A1C7MQD1_GRIFR|nr:hypothetical protein A0H81_00111 [Grifola frondosa]